MKKNVLLTLTALTLAFTALTQIGCSAEVEDNSDNKLFDYVNENPTKPLDLVFSTQANPIYNAFTITQTSKDNYDVMFNFVPPSTQQYEIYNPSLSYSGCTGVLPTTTEYMAKNDGNGNLDVLGLDLTKPFELTSGQKYSFLINLSNIKECTLLKYSFAVVERGVVSKPVTPPVSSREKSTTFASTKFILCDNSSAQIEIDLGSCNLSQSCSEKSNIKYTLKSAGVQGSYSAWMSTSQSGGSYSFSWFDDAGNDYVAVSTYYFTDKEAYLEIKNSKLDNIECEFYK